MDKISPRKNDVVTIEITGMTAEGSGVGRTTDGMAVFVPAAAVGDTAEVVLVKVLKSYAFGKILALKSAANTRITPDCAAFPQCGGCVFRHISYAEELRIKDGFVRDSFARIGKLDVPFEPPEAAPETARYRNKAQFPVAEKDGKAVCGFYAKNSHRVIPVADCALEPEVFLRLTARVLEYVNRQHIAPYDERTGKGLLRHIYLRRGAHTGETMVCLVTADNAADEFRPLAQALTAEFPEIVSVVLNVNRCDTNVILGNKTLVLAGRETITDRMCGNEITLSPHAFYQVNTPAAEGLYRIAAEYAELTGAETLLDLYCGAGTIGLSMAGKAKKVIGVEEVAPAIANARANAAANGITNAEFLCGDAGKTAELLLARGERPNVIIADPARKGCDQTALDAMLALAPERIVMISCNHATAARDCAYLCANGYRAVRARAVDLFPRTGHVETCVLMSRNI
ncbi:MAG: 23S rRNA (uracil(1939)-C(5))-methyltransferase RlmD [Oscillospiraceae bacterium]